MEVYEHFIDGRTHSGDTEPMTTVDPFTEQGWAHVPVAGRPWP